MATNLSLNILGFPAVNGELQVNVRDSSGTTVKTGRPFLDGTVKIGGLPPGLYELDVTHPNVTLPVIHQPIRILPTGDTLVSVLIDPSKFRNTPIADIPDANLGPVRDRTQTISETLLPLMQKQPGEAITAQDWNAMASGIRELALATGELTRLVSPNGHDHPEIVDKIQEMVDNFTQLLNTLGAAMTELQRQIQSLRYRKQLSDVLDAAAADDATRQEFLTIVNQLDQAVTDTPIRYGRTARTVGVQLATRLQQLVEANAANADFAGSTLVTNFQDSTELLKGIRSTSYSSELEQLRNVDRKFGVGGLSDVVTGMKRG